MLRILGVVILVLGTLTGFGCAYNTRTTVPDRLDLVDAETQSAVGDQVLLVPLFEQIDGWGFGLDQTGGSLYRLVVQEPMLYRPKDRLGIRNRGLSGWVAGIELCVVWRMRGEVLSGVLIVTPRYEPRILWFEKSFFAPTEIDEKPVAEVPLSLSKDPRIDLEDLRRIFDVPSDFGKRFGYWRGCASLAGRKKVETSFSEADKRMILGFLERASSNLEELPTGDRGKQNDFGPPVLSTRMTEQDSPTVSGQHQLTQIRRSQ